MFGIDRAKPSPDMIDVLVALLQLCLIDHMYVMPLSLPQCVECTNCTAFSILQENT